MKYIPVTESLKCQQPEFTYVFTIDFANLMAKRWLFLIYPGIYDKWDL